MIVLGLGKVVVYGEGEERGIGGIGCKSNDYFRWFECFMIVLILYDVVLKLVFVYYILSMCLLFEEGSLVFYNLNF